MENEALYRLSIFIGLFLLFAGLELVFPRRALQRSKPRRWVTNWAMVILSTLMLRGLALFLPLLAVGAALDAEAQGWGLFNRTGLPGWIEITIAVLVFDFVLWLQHLITHKVPILWRLHRVHHADLDFDVSTAIRFHPVEIGLSMLLKIGVVYLLGPAALAVVIFEVLLNGTALFTHSNLRLPPWLDAPVRRVLVTPDMHRVHHSVHRDEHDRNYGFALSVWDRLFGTYLAQPRAGHDGMEIGLHWRDDAPTRLGWSLWLPFRRR